MEVNARGQFDKADVDRAYHGHGRLTGHIVADVMAQCQGRKGVLFFAATVRHAEEVMASLPPEMSALVTGKTPKPERESILARFKDQQIKYLVNVAVLTTGFDAPHVDCIAILRKTESAGLWAQIMGRGLRLCDGKEDCLVLDYTSNIDDHFPDGDLFDPKIEAGKPSNLPVIDAICPDCSYMNTFKVNPDFLDRDGQLTNEFDVYGYVEDLDGQQIMTPHGPMPIHLGRRCNRKTLTGENGTLERCGYRWTFKECRECEAPNDFAARYCCSCGLEMVNPNEKLRAEFKLIKRDPTQIQTDVVMSMVLVEGISQAGNKTVRADFVTPYRSFSVWFVPESKGWKQREEWTRFNNATDGGSNPPGTVTYRKDRESGFYRLIDLDREADHEPEENEHPNFWKSDVSRKVPA